MQVKLTRLITEIFDDFSRTNIIRRLKQSNNPPELAKKLIDRINKKDASVAKKIKWFIGIPKNLRSDFRINKDGVIKNIVDIKNDLVDRKITDEGVENAMKWYDAFQKECENIIGKIAMFNNMPHHSEYEDIYSTDLYTDIIQKIPTGVGKAGLTAGIKFRELLNKDAVQRYRKNCARRFQNIFKNIIDPKTSHKLEGEGGIPINIMSRQVIGRTKNEAQTQLLQDIFGTQYGENKFGATLDEKIREALTKIFKGELHTTNPHLQKIIKMISNNMLARGESEVSKHSAYVPYAYLMGLYYSKNKEERDAFIDFCKLLIEYNLYYGVESETKKAKLSDEEYNKWVSKNIKSYEVFNKNLAHEKEFHKKYGKYYNIINQWLKTLEKITQLKKGQYTKGGANSKNMIPKLIVIADNLMNKLPKEVINQLEYDAEQIEAGEDSQYWYIEKAKDKPTGKEYEHEYKFSDRSYKPKLENIIKTYYGEEYVPYTDFIITRMINGNKNITQEMFDNDTIENQLAMLKRFLTQNKGKDWQQVKTVIDADLYKENE